MVPKFRASSVVGRDKHKDEFCLTTIFRIKHINSTEKEKQRNSAIMEKMEIGKQKKKYPFFLGGGDLLI